MIDMGRMKLNDDYVHVNNVIKALVKKDWYCPCVVGKSEDTKCPCKKFRSTGECCCGLWKVEEES